MFLFCFFFLHCLMKKQGLFTMQDSSEGGWRTSRVPKKSNRLLRSEGVDSDEFDHERSGGNHSDSAADIQDTSDAGDEVVEMTHPPSVQAPSSARTQPGKRHRHDSASTDLDVDRPSHCRIRHTRPTPTNDPTDAPSTASSITPSHAQPITSSTAPATTPSNSGPVPLTHPIPERGGPVAYDIVEFFERGTTKGGQIRKTVCKRCR
jgi:hypothetical protein